MASDPMEELVPSLAPLKNQGEPEEDVVHSRDSAPTKAAALIGTAKAAIAHWNEFGPARGFDEDMDAAFRCNRRP